MPELTPAEEAEYKQIDEKLNALYDKRSKGESRSKIFGDLMKGLLGEMIHFARRHGERGLLDSLTRIGGFLATEEKLDADEEALQKRRHVLRLKREGAAQEK